ncbi:hypothetical protein [Algibacter sp. R77976]|uniref:hypothetical protein n=1 Tax=Algibacter sp. R77976 TaxID=3093873 RepID=UPI0037CB872A
MAPINFEDNIKDKLDKRTLKPSVGAWDKLSERLDNNDKKDKTIPFWWFGIAASIVGVLLVVSQFFNNETKVNDTPILVDTPEVINNQNTNSIVVENEKTDDNPIIKTKPEKVNVESPGIKNLIISKKEQQLVGLINESEIVSKDNSSNEIKTTQELNQKSLTFEEQKIQELVAQVKTMNSKNQVVTDADIDVLLKAAQKEIKLNRLYNETTGVVDANALLQDVETELDQSSFRNKVFEALKASYNSVKTTIAQRND